MILSRRPEHGMYEKFSSTILYYWSKLSNLSLFSIGVATFSVEGAEGGKLPALVPLFDTTAARMVACACCLTREQVLL